MIDCSGSAEVAERYEGWLAAGIHVVTPNKQAGAGPLPRYQRIRAAAAASGARFRYEATVGAGLPVITTLRDLVDTGDEVLAIEGIFSGTLAGCSTASMAASRSRSWSRRRGRWATPSRTRVTIFRAWTWRASW